MTSWVRSSSCGSSACVEVAFFGRCVNVRDSKLGPASPVQRWEIGLWRWLIAAVGARGPVADGDEEREFSGHTAIDIGPSSVRLGMWNDEKLLFTLEEWNAFVAGVLRGEFDLDRLKSQSPSWSGMLSISGASASSASGQSVPADVPEAAAVHRHDTAVAAAGEGASNPPSPAALTDSPAGPEPLRGRALDEATGCATSPQSQARVSGQPGPDDARAAARAAVVARYEGIFGDAGGFHEALHAYADVAVDAFLQVIVGSALRWGAGPLVQHVPEDSRPTRGGQGGDPVEGGADVASTGGEVVPGPVGVPISSSPGATSSEGSSVGGWVADDPAEGGAGPVERTAGPAEGDAWFVADHERGWTRVES